MPLIETAQRAFETVKFYRMIYGTKPTTDEHIPFISHVHFHRTRNVLDCVAEGSEILGAVPCYLQSSRNLPVTPVESGEEWQYRLDRLVSGLEHLGLSTNNERYRFLIVAEQVTGVFASYLSDQLGWLRQQASITYADFPGFDVELTLRSFRPDVVIMLMPPANFPLDANKRSDAQIVVVAHIEKFSQQCLNYDRLLVCDELHVVAASQAGHENYYYDETKIYLETDPRSARLAVTLPDFTCWPWVRYLIGGPIAIQALGQSSDA